MESLCWLLVYLFVPNVVVPVFLHSLPASSVSRLRVYIMSGTASMEVSFHLYMKDIQTVRNYQTVYKSSSVISEIIKRVFVPPGTRKGMWVSTPQEQLYFMNGLSPI